MKNVSEMAPEMKHVTSFGGDGLATGALFSDIEDKTGVRESQFDYTKVPINKDEYGFSDHALAIRKFLYSSEQLRKPVDMKRWMGRSSSRSSIWRQQRMNGMYYFNR